MKLTKNQIKDYEMIHFHLVDLKNTLNDPKYTKEFCLDELQHIIDYVKHTIDIYSNKP